MGTGSLATEGFRLIRKMMGSRGTRRPAQKMRLKDVGL